MRVGSASLVTGLRGRLVALRDGELCLGESGDAAAGLGAGELGEVDGEWGKDEAGRGAHRRDVVGRRTEDCPQQWKVRDSLCNQIHKRIGCRSSETM